MATRELKIVRQAEWWLKQKEIYFLSSNNWLNFVKSFLEKGRIHAFKKASHHLLINLNRT